MTTDKAALVFLAIVLVVGVVSIYYLLWLVNPQLALGFAIGYLIRSLM